MEDQQQTREEGFFKNPDMFNVYKKTNPVEVLEFIKLNSPISIWDLTKKLDINRNTLYSILRDFQFSGLIRSELITNEHNRHVRMIYYNKNKECENDN